MDKTTTRSTLSEAVFKNVGLSRNESATLVDSVGNFCCSAKKRKDWTKSQNWPRSSNNS